jgi:hypothetical protein
MRARAPLGQVVSAPFSFIETELILELDPQRTVVKRGRQASQVLRSQRIEAEAG